MFAPALTVILCLLPALGQADCLVQSDILGGVNFERQDGHLGQAVLNSDQLRINYASDAASYLDKRNTAIGIYETSWTWLPYEAEATDQRLEYRYSYSGQPPLPQENITWKSEVTVQETPTLGPPKTYVLNATYSFQPLRRANLSDCSYQVIPVEARFSGNGVDYTRRWFYFTELGFGLEVRVTDNLTGASRGLGLTRLTAIR